MAPVKELEHRLFLRLIEIESTLCHHIDETIEDRIIVGGRCIRGESGFIGEGMSPLSIG